MKAAKQYREQWEEANWLRLLLIAHKTYELFSNLFKKTLIAINVFFYINYLALKGLWLITQLLLLTAPEGLNRIEREETWVFRQIK